MTNISTIQLGLTPHFYDVYYDSVYESLKSVLIRHKSIWNSSKNKYPNYSLTFYIVTKKGNESLRTKGPSISRKYLTIDYSIFLPDMVNDKSHYIDLVFEGLCIIFEEYSDSKSEIIKMRDECKLELTIE